MFIESAVEERWINSDQVLYFEIVKSTEFDPEKPGDPYECWFLVAHMRNGRTIRMESAGDPETIEDMMRSYQDQIEDYEQRR